MIFAIDPGPVQSAYAELDYRGRIVRADIEQNEHLVRILRDFMMSQDRREPNTIIIEGMSSYGAPVGKTVFDTVIWIGRFEQVVWDGEWTPVLVGRRNVWANVVGTRKGQKFKTADAQIRHALLNRYGKVATKGFKKDMWSALAIATYARDNFVS